ncbi:MAG TPA: PEP-CTERM sorting domain-containing protein [Bryobacteraceae bacterium]|nr:PEP-CTERM sorting domain-containing protein [Bryobacteraceae bacterium]
MRRTLVLFGVVAVAVVPNAVANGVSCTLNSVVQSCYEQNQVPYNETINWLTGLGEAYGGPHSGAWTTSNEAVNVTLSSTSALLRSDNTGFAWDGSVWTLPDFAPDGMANIAGSTEYISTFAGHFGAPNLPSTIAPYATPSAADLGSQFGDDLVGTLGGGALTISFATPVTSAGFMISTRDLTNFTATLQGYDAAGNLVGTYLLSAIGLGGTCSGLGDFSTGNPQPCTDPSSSYYSPAPFIALLGQNNDISKLVLWTNDSNGFFIDQMYVDQPQVPEPETLILLGSGLCLFGWLLRRRARRSL